MNSPTLPKFLLPCVALTAVLSAVSIVQRHRVEALNRSVSICAEYETIESLAASQGITIDRALESLHAQGLRSVTLTEEYAGDLVSEGRLAVRYEPGKPAGEGSKTFAPIVSGAPDDMRRLIRGNRIRYGAFSIPSQVGPIEQQFPKLTPGMLRALPVGLDPEAAQHVLQAHLTIVARLGNPTGISPQGVEDTITWAHELGATVFCPIGDQVLGRRDGKGALVDALRRHNMLYASPEFAKIGGDEQMLEAASDIAVRLHPAQAAELDKMVPAEAVDRYARAARERNMRILLLRPIDFAAAEPLFKFGDFTKDVAKAVEKLGCELGDAHKFTPPNVPRPLFPLIALSLAPIAWWAGSVLHRNLGWAGLGAALLTGVAAWSPHERQYAALLGAITLPVTAFFVLDALKTRSVWQAYTGTTLVSLTGGLVVAGLLNSVPYYVRAVEFPGVKLAVFLPIVVVAAYFTWRLTPARETLKSPVAWGSALLTLVILGALGLMLARTGNDNPAAVSSWELKIRDILDATLFVRPRTKAFLIGFPLLYVGVAMLMRYRGIASVADSQEGRRLGGWVALMLAGGAIGQTDIVNTLCHIHTPVALSLERIGVEFVVGTVLGVVAWAVIAPRLRLGRSVGAD